MKYMYKLTEETLSDDDLGSYKTYGIECVDKSKGAVLYRISDVSTSRKRMTAAVDMFNSMGVSLISKNIVYNYTYIAEFVNTRIKVLNR